MAIPTTRAKEPGIILINEDLCIGCGQCVKFCPDECLTLENNKAKESGKAIFGCVACGHCMLICQQGAIKIEGRCISEQDVFVLPNKEKSTSYESLLALLQRRRSVRQFKDKPVEKEIINKVIEAAQTAPMGLPPSDVHVLVFDSKEKVHAFAKDFCNFLEGMKWFISKWFIFLMRPIWGKAMDEMMKGFIRPCFHAFTDNMKKDVNVVSYDAPVALYFYGTPYSDPADPIITATYAMLTAESLGLGTCMLGAIHPFIQNGKAAKKFREKYNIKYTSREGLFVIMGYPNVKFSKGIKRSFAGVDWN